MTIIDISTFQGNLDWQAVKSAGVTHVIIRGPIYDRWVDDRYVTNWADARDAGIPFREVYGDVSRLASGSSQALNFIHQTGGDFGTGPATIDIERTNEERAEIEAGTLVWDKVAYTAMLLELVTALQAVVPVRIYTSRVEWLAMTTDPEWAKPMLHWIAHYNPNISAPDRPDGWTWQLWQKGQMSVDGIENPVDYNVENMNAIGDRQQPGPWIPTLYPGPQHGMAGQQNDQIAAITQMYFNLGMRVGMVTTVHNPGKLVQVKSIDPRIVTVCRFLNPNSNYEGGQDSEKWSDPTVYDWISKGQAMLVANTSPEEYQQIDYFILGYNEWKILGDGVAAGNVWKKLLQAATTWDPNAAYKRKSTDPRLHPLRLGFLCCPQGNPEYNQMQGVKSTGLFQVAYQGGHALILHEGEFWNQPADQDEGIAIPGAPYCPPGAGLGTGRVFFWFIGGGIDCPVMFTEEYDGLTWHVDPAIRYVHMHDHDRRYRRLPNYRGYSAYEVIDDRGSQWSDTDFTAMFQSQAMISGWKAETNELNPLGGNVPDVTVDDYNSLVELGKTANSTAQQINTILAKYASNWWNNLPNGVFPVSKKTTNAVIGVDFYHLPTDATPYTTRTYDSVGVANIDVYERSNDRFRVTTSPAIWVRAEQLQQFS